jgi:hypothetical protein
MAPKIEKSTADYSQGGGYQKPAGIFLTSPQKKHPNEKQKAEFGMEIHLGFQITLSLRTML